MRYFVIGDDGQKYGPADVATLNSWITEGRLLATTLLENEATGERVAAQALPGLAFDAVGIPTRIPPTATPPSGPGYSAYPRPGYTEDTSNDMLKAWIFCVLGLCCCPIVFCSLGYLAGKRANEKGNPAGRTAMIANVVAGIISIVLGIAFTRIGGR
jgi:hypothetical protein